MSKYLKVPFPKVENPFDGHIHIHKWREEDTGRLYIHGLEEYRQVCGLKYIALAALPSGNPIPVSRDVSNNIMCAFYKLANENTFAYGGFIYPSYPASAEEMSGMFLTTQLEELYEIGFDGVKMLEGKPNLYAKVGQPLDGEFFDSALSKLEKDGTYVLMHALDPASFWTDANEENVKKGWYYGDESKYPSNSELYRQVDAILEKHPKLNLCLAHFFFSSENPERLEQMLAKYPNLCIDITPGGEMYHGFDKRPEYYKDFFVRYADRIIFGTDMDFTPHLEAGIWLCDRVYRYLATDETISSFGDRMLKGLNLPADTLQRIFSDNLVSKLGHAPKPVNKDALRRYIAKYRHLIVDKELDKYIDELSQEYL